MRYYWVPDRNDNPGDLSNGLAPRLPEFWEDRLMMRAEIFVEQGCCPQSALPFEPDKNARIELWATDECGGNGSMQDQHRGARTDGAPAFVPVPLPVYWINLASATDRAVYMRDQLSRVTAIVAHQVAAVTKNDTIRMVATGELETPVIIEKCAGWGPDNDGDCSGHHKKARPEYSRVEIACTTSHLKTIQMAYDNGDELALILEDDVTIPEFFVKVVDGVLGDAPPGWEIIQFTPKSAQVLEQVHHIRDRYVQWMPQYYGTGSYLINRRGMKAIVDKLTKGLVADESGARRHKFKIPYNVAVADEVIFVFVNSYTFVRQQIGFASPMAYPSVIHKSKWVYRQRDWMDRLIQRARSRCTAAVTPYIVVSANGRSSKTVLSITIYRDTNDDSLARVQLGWLAANVAAMKKWGFHWHVFVVVGNTKGEDHSAARIQTWRNLISTLATRQPEFDDGLVTIQFRKSMSPGKSSKWLYFSEIPNRDDIIEFNNVIFVDGEMNFVGFPWGEFFLRHLAFSNVINHKIIGITQQIHSESLKSTQRSYNSWYTPLDGTYWHNCWRHDATAIPSDFVEQNFAMMDTGFMMWFIRHVMTPRILKEHKATDFGVDHIWCGAAREYASLQGGIVYEADCRDNKSFVDSHNFTCENWHGFRCGGNEKYCEPDGTTCWSPGQLAELRTQCCHACRASEAMVPKCLLIPLIMHRQNYPDPANGLLQYGKPDYPVRNPHDPQNKKLFLYYNRTFPEWAALSEDFKMIFSKTDSKSNPKSCHTTFDDFTTKPLEYKELDRIVYREALVKRDSKTADFMTLPAQRRRDAFTAHRATLNASKRFDSIAATIASLEPTLKLRLVPNLLSETDLGGKVGKGDLLVYWINLATATDRAVVMATKLDSMESVSHTKVVASDRASVSELIRYGDLIVDAKVISRCTAKDGHGKINCWIHHTKKVPEYTIVEVACVTSHLRAIHLAYSNGDELALILEDDIVVPSNLRSKIAGLLREAPRGWEIIQLTPKNGMAIEQFHGIHDNFVSWMPQYYGTGSYLINRHGMRRILAQFSQTKNGTKDKITFHIPKQVVVADELLYAFVNSYTTTRIFTGFESTSKFPSAIQEGSWAEGSAETIMLEKHMVNGHKHSCRPKVVPTLLREKHLLLVTMYRDDGTEKRMSEDLVTLSDNVVATKPWGFHYHVLVILKRDARQPVWEAAAKLYPELDDTVQIHYRTNPGRFSKWIYWDEVTRRHDITEFGNTVFADGDLNFAGFPWGEFFLRHKAFLDQYQHKVVGVSRQSYMESMLSTKTSYNSWYTAMDGEYWQHCTRSKVTAAPADFLEQFFVMMDTGFMLWFMSHVLDSGWVDKHRQLATDYGIDTLWCGAAREYHQLTLDKDQTPCDDSLTFIDSHGFDCLEWRTRDCQVREKVCYGLWCYGADELREIRKQCCSCWTETPKCLLLPLIMHHKDTRSLTGDRSSSSAAFRDFEVAGARLAQLYLDEFPEWAFWASRFRGFFKGAWSPTKCKGLDFLSFNGIPPAQSAELDQNTRNAVAVPAKDMERDWLCASFPIEYGV